MADGEPLELGAVHQRFVPLQDGSAGLAQNMDGLLVLAEPVVGRALVVGEIGTLHIVYGQRVTRSRIAEQVAAVAVDLLAVLPPAHLRFRFAVHAARQFRVVAFGDADETQVDFDLRPV